MNAVDRVAVEAFCAAVLASAATPASLKLRAEQMRAKATAAPKPRGKGQAPPAGATTQGWLWGPCTGIPWQLSPDSYVQCSHYAAKLKVKVCLERQAARWPGGNRMGDGSVKKKTASIYAYCGSGACTEGNEYRAVVVYEPTLVKNPGRIFYRKDMAAQRKKRRIWIRSNLDHVPSIDDPPGQQGRPTPLDLADPDVRQILDGDVEP